MLWKTAEGWRIRCDDAKGLKGLDKALKSLKSRWGVREVVEGLGNSLRGFGRH